CIDDDAAAALGNAQLKSARHAHLALEGGYQVNGRLGLLALPDPAGRGGLRIVIDEDGALAPQGEMAGEIDRDGRLARTALGVQHDDALHVLPCRWNIMPARSVRIGGSPRKRGYIR